MIMRRHERHEGPLLNLLNLLSLLNFASPAENFSSFSNFSWVALSFRIFACAKLDLMARTLMPTAPRRNAANAASGVTAMIESASN